MIVASRGSGASTSPKSRLGADGLGDRADALERVLGLGEPTGLERAGDAVVPGCERPAAPWGGRGGLRSRGAGAGADEQRDDEPAGPADPSFREEAPWSGALTDKGRGPPAGA